MATVSLAGARRLTIVTLSCVFAVGATAGPPPAGAASPVAGSCPAAGVAPAYTKRILDVLGAGREVWGDRLLALPGGPSHAAARRYLKPLMFARGAQGRSLTASGVYYLPFAQPDGARGAGSVALHVADGSQIVSQHVGGAALTVLVGSSGRERFGSCLARLATPALAGGYLPILETRYVDSTGVQDVYLEAKLALDSIQEAIDKSEARPNAMKLDPGFALSQANYAEKGAQTWGCMVLDAKK